MLPALSVFGSRYTGLTRPAMQWHDWFHRARSTGRGGITIDEADLKYHRVASETPGCHNRRQKTGIQGKSISHKQPII
jgi:hypothetical protein